MLNVRNLTQKIAANDNLPNKISELLFLAIKDMRKVENDSDYGFDMSVYTDEITNGLNEKICLVCVAGAVMVKTLRLPKGIEAIPRSYKNTKIGDKLRAIDSLRRLDHIDAYLYLVDSNKLQTYNKAIKREKRSELEQKLDSVISGYMDKTKGVKSFDDITQYAHKHISFYTAYAELLKSAGL